MATNTLNTRITLKIDALSTWMASTFKPLNGEVCIAKVDTIEGSQLQPIMIKIGDNEHTFAELDWISAKAADVYGWAKAKDVVLNGESLEFKDAAGTVLKSVDLSVFTTSTELATALGGYYTKDEVDAKDAATLTSAKSYVDEEDIFVTDILTVNATGGIAAGTDLNGKTTHEVLKALLYPYIEPAVENPTRTPNSSTLEKGNDQTITAVSVKVTKKSEAITSVALYDASGNLIDEKTGTDVANGGTITFSGLSISVPSTNVKLTVKVTDAKGTVISKETPGWTFVYPYYYGVCAEGAEITEDLVEGLAKKVEGKGTKTDWSFTLNNQCIVFAYPKAHGVLKSIIDPNNFEIIGSFTRHEVPVTGLDGTTQAYYVYVGGAASATDFKVDFKY